VFLRRSLKWILTRVNIKPTFSRYDSICERVTGFPSCWDIGTAPVQMPEVSSVAKPHSILRCPKLKSLVWGGDQIQQVFRAIDMPALENVVVDLSKVTDMVPLRASIRTSHPPPMVRSMKFLAVVTAPDAIDIAVSLDVVEPTVEEIFVEILEVQSHKTHPCEVILGTLSYTSLGRFPNLAKLQVTDRESLVTIHEGGGL
jgi:hypothetical protein